jgi:hypothetical protein
VALSSSAIERKDEPAIAYAAFHIEHEVAVTLTYNLYLTVDEDSLLSLPPNIVSVAPDDRATEAALNVPLKNPEFLPVEGFSGSA